MGAGFFANVGETRREGGELTLSLTTGPVDWRVAYCYTRATFASPYQFASDTNSSAVDTDGDGVRDTVFVKAGARMPGIPAHTLKLQGDWRVIRDLSAGASVVCSSGTYARGDENNQDANGMVPGYAVVELEASYVFLKGLRLSVKIDNLFNARYSDFGILGQNAFTGPGRAFGPSHGIETAPEQFRAVGAPRGAWAILEYRLGGD